MDCTPGPTMVDGYRCAAADPAHRDVLLCGAGHLSASTAPTGYDLATLATMVDPHPGPMPDPGGVVVSTDYRLLWSSSFAVTAATWRRVGDFCTCYRGYGARTPTSRN
ncbi:MAG TPA: hypothetical protein VH496_21980 [Mycobacterium sp.]